MARGLIGNLEPVDKTRRRGRLVVVVSSIMDDPSSWDSLVPRLRTLPGYGDEECRWAFIPHGARWYRPGSAEQLAREIAARIHSRWVADGGYDEVVLVGHSIGGLLVRQAYLVGLGNGDPDQGRPWAERVNRIILFASLNRGFKVSFERALWLPPMAWLARVLPGIRGLLVRDVLRGSEFITNLRVSWISTVNTRERPPLIVQFLGRDDRLVREDDSRDIEAFPTGVQEMVPDATHRDLIRLDIAPDPEVRFRLIASAFTRVPPEEPARELGDESQRVVMVLHGIRATNTTWARDLEQHISTIWPDTEVITASYGRFSARKFMIPATRRRFLGWLEDTYSERLASNPKATFHFIGHSNGTYLLGHSLARIPGMRFDRVLLVGSVLPTDYDWRGRRAARQVQMLRNDRAARDVPVGVLCSGLRALGMRDIGTAGVDGFYAWDDPAKREVFYYKGGHSAALAPENLASLAAYVMDGAATEPAGLPREPPRSFSLLSRAAPYLGWLVVAGAVAGGTWFVRNGPWSSRYNATALAGGIVVAFVALDVI
jgi:alpha-beta hydrolase superfamily lysophospholipase